VAYQLKIHRLESEGKEKTAMIGGVRILGSYQVEVFDRRDLAEARRLEYKAEGRKVELADLWEKYPCK